VSAIRDVRLLIARHLDLSTPVRTCVLDVLNILDASLDSEGYEAPAELHAALRRLDYAIINDEPADDDLPIDNEEEEDDDDDLVDMDFFDEDDDDDFDDDDEDEDDDDED
jgi:hypothetical protein